jgi:hypothetical protein
MKETFTLRISVESYKKFRRNFKAKYNESARSYFERLADHIEEGKSQLNFQEFAALKPKPGGKYKTVAELQNHKLEEVRESQTDKWMPLDSYTWIHKEAKLTDGQRKLLIDWVDSASAQITAKSVASLQQ